MKPATAITLLAAWIWAFQGCDYKAKAWGRADRLSEKHMEQLIQEPICLMKCSEYQKAIT